MRLPPKITAHPESYIYRESENDVELVCVAEGSPAPEFKWLKDGVDYTPRSGVVVVGGNAGTLQFSEMYNTDEGEYQCYATNMYGTAISRIASLGKTFTASNPDTTVKDHRVNVGQELTVSSLVLILINTK